MQQGTVESKNLVVFGAGGHAKSVSAAAVSQGFVVMAFIAPSKESPSFLGLPVYPRYDQELAEQGALAFVAMGDNRLREQVQKTFEQAWPEVDLATIVHPSASISNTAVLHRGVAVLQGAVIGSHTEVQTGALINSGAVVDHDCQIGAFASIGPGAILGGSVSIGGRAQIGIGATIANNMAIGDSSIVGGASYVHKSIPSQVVAYGVPAKVIRSLAGDFNYVK